jgi:hypothetical protein
LIQVCLWPSTARTYLVIGTVKTEAEAAKVLWRTVGWYEGRGWSVHGDVGDWEIVLNAPKGSPVPINFNIWIERVPTPEVTR